MQKPTQLGESPRDRDMTETFQYITLDDCFDGQAIPSQAVESIQDRIVRIGADLDNLNAFYDIDISPNRHFRTAAYYQTELKALTDAPFDEYDQEEKVDYLLLKSYLERSLWQFKLGISKDEQMKELLPFSPTLLMILEARRQAEPMNTKHAARYLVSLKPQISGVGESIDNKRIKVEKEIAYRAVKTIEQLRKRLEEWFNFYKGYDPMFTWWVSEPYPKVDKALAELASIIAEKLVGVKPGDDFEDVIVGEPIGREGLMHDLDAEKIPYTPEQLIKLGELEYDWCENEMKKATHALGVEDWREALNYVKSDFVEPGQQPEFVRNLILEGAEYVKKYDMVTVPPISEETWRILMMPPSKQKVNPFFLGGKNIQVAYPTDTMDHEAKMMSLRGNNKHFARATAFHEMIPGHHLQFYYLFRSRPYRMMFFTPFCTEGWAFYWEMLFWERDSWKKTPQNRIGMLFWRMHRCARILFSLKFHLGQMTPQECMDLLVDWVGHERATAEGEVRRSFNGEYSPLYQAGYMLGGLQLYALRKEVVDTGMMTEKQFHDRFLRENSMPVELFRALIQNKELSHDYKPSWKFYDGI